MDTMTVQTVAPVTFSEGASKSTDQQTANGRQDAKSNNQGASSPAKSLKASAADILPIQATLRHLSNKTEAGSSKHSTSPVSGRPPPKRSSGRTEGTRSSSGPAVQKTLTDKVSDIRDKDRQEHASNIIKVITSKTKEDIQSGGFSLPVGDSADSFGLKLGLAVEFAFYLKFWGSEDKPSTQYGAKMMKIHGHLSTNLHLRRQVLMGVISPKQLSGLSDEEITRGLFKDNNNQASANGHHGEEDKHPSSSVVQDKTSGRIKICFKEKDDKKTPSTASRKNIGQGVTRLKEQPNNRKCNRFRGTKRDRDADSTDDERLDVKHEQVPTSKAKDHSRRIEELNKITAGYIQPDPKDVAVAYLDTSLHLPSDAPLGWPHLIDLTTLNGTDTTGLHVADMVVTVLYNHNPDTLARFMDMSHNFTFHVKEPLTSDDQDFLVIRTALAVTVGFVDEGEKWSVKHKYGLRATPMAMWTPLFLQDYQEGGLEEDAIIVDDVVQMMVAGEALAFEMLEAQVWKAKEGARIHVRNSAAWRS